MSTEVVASWTPVIVKGSIFQASVAFTDENGDPTLLLSASFEVEPNGSPPFAWTQANGKFINTGVGTYLLSLTEADTAALSWTAGRYHVDVVESGGETNLCVLEGLIFAKEC